MLIEMGSAVHYERVCAGCGELHAEHGARRRVCVHSDQRTCIDTHSELGIEPDPFFGGVKDVQLVRSAKSHSIP